MPTQTARRHGTTAEELETKYPGIASELKALALWYNRRVDQLELQLHHRPTLDFHARGTDFAAAFAKFPKEAARTEKIVQLLKGGAPLWPIFPDKQGLIMEGRHRLVAALTLQIKTIPTVLVRKRDVAPTPKQ